MTSANVSGPAEEPTWQPRCRYPILTVESEPLVALIRRAQREQASSSSSISSSSTEREPWTGTSHSRRAPVSPPVTRLSAAAFYVPDLPGRPADMQLPAMYSGHLPAAYAIARSGGSAAPAAVNADTNAAGIGRRTRPRRLMVEGRGKGKSKATSRDVDATDPTNSTPTNEEDDGIENDAHLFFLLVKAKHIAQREKLVLWFNGGPGCSSFDGALLEIGPVKVQGAGDAAVLEDNPGKWNEYANVLFIDQPAGTGYSYINKGQPVAELAPAAEQIVQFLSNFYALFPEYARMDTYIAGESYAGTTIPYLARAIVSTTSLQTRLEGLLIGNGWFSPADQYPAYAAYGRARGFLNKQNDETRAVARLEKQCNAALNSTEGRGHVLVGTCEGLIDAVMRAGRTTIDTNKYCMGAYDVRPSEFYGEYPNGLQFATPYLQQPDVVEAFHATDKHAKWAQCNTTVGSQMWSPRSRPSVELLPELLEQMPMLLFAGDADLMCSWIGIENMLNNLTWRGETGFGDAVEEEWTVNGTVTGTWRTARNMTWVKVADAGHMVPINQPYAAQDILLRFLGIDTLIAAGDGSQIPSRIGRVSSGVEAVIGKVAPDGGTLPAVISQQEKQAAAAASSAAAAVDFYAEEGQPIDKERELLYGPRRSAVLMLIIVAVALAFYALLRWRARKRRAAGWTPKRYMPPGSGRSGLGTPAGSGTYRFNRLSLSSSAPNTPVRGGGRRKRERESLQLSEMNLLKRIEEHEHEVGDGLDIEAEHEKPEAPETARNVFALGEEDESYEDLASASPESGQPRRSTGRERARSERSAGNAHLDGEG